MEPVTNYELGKNLHREYEAEASRSWNFSQSVTPFVTPGGRLPGKLKLTMKQVEKTLPAVSLQQIWIKGVAHVRSTFSSKTTG